MGRFIIGEEQYVVYGENSKEVQKVLITEMQRVDNIKWKISWLLKYEEKAYENFMENVSEENLNIHFNDRKSCIFDDEKEKDTIGMVRQRTVENGKYMYNLAYRYDGEDTDFKLAHEMGHLLLNPSTTKKQTYDEKTNSTQVSGLIRKSESDAKFYGTCMQENAINILAELAIRGNIYADKIMHDEVSISTMNSYKKVDCLVKKLAISMTNNYEEDMTFEELVEAKLDSTFTSGDGEEQPRNIFFYGLLNDTSIIENDFDKYMDKGAYRELDHAITVLHSLKEDSQKFKDVYEHVEGFIEEYGIIRKNEKTKGKVITEKKEKKEVVKNDDVEKIKVEKLPFGIKIAKFLQKNKFLSSMPLVEKYISKKLHILPAVGDTNINKIEENRASKTLFINSITNYEGMPYKESGSARSGNKVGNNIRNSAQIDTR